MSEQRPAARVRDISLFARGWPLAGDHTGATLIYHAPGPYPGEIAWRRCVIILGITIELIGMGG